MGMIDRLPEEAPHNAHDVANDTSPLRLCLSLLQLLVLLHGLERLLELDRSVKVDLLESALDEGDFVGTFFDFARSAKAVIVVVVVLVHVDLRLREIVNVVMIDRTMVVDVVVVVVVVQVIIMVVGSIVDSGDRRLVDGWGVMNRLNRLNRLDRQRVAIGLSLELIEFDVFDGGSRGCFDGRLRRQFGLNDTPGSRCLFRHDVPGDGLVCLIVKAGKGEGWAIIGKVRLAGSTRSRHALRGGRVRRGFRKDRHGRVAPAAANGRDDLGGGEQMLDLAFFKVAVKIRHMPDGGGGVEVAVNHLTIHAVALLITGQTAADGEDLGDGALLARLWGRLARDRGDLDTRHAGAALSIHDECTSGAALEDKEGGGNGLRDGSGLLPTSREPFGTDQHILNGFEHFRPGIVLAHDEDTRGTGGAKLDNSLTSRHAVCDIGLGLRLGWAPGRALLALGTLDGGKVHLAKRVNETLGVVTGGARLNSGLLVREDDGGPVLERDVRLSETAGDFLSGAFGGEPGVGPDAPRDRGNGTRVERFFDGPILGELGILPDALRLWSATPSDYLQVHPGIPPCAFYHQS